MDSGKLFYEDEFEALSLMISGSDKTFKEVASYLFPHLKTESAYARLKACLNPEKDERMTFGQIIAAMNFCCRYDPIYFACDDTLHHRPARKAPEDEETKFIEAIQQAASTMDKAMRQLEALRTSSIRLIKAA